MASVLEAARVLAAASCYRPQFSVYFVAFDGEESGCRGSQEFIYSHLKPHLDLTGGQVQGAYILDTLLNYDNRPGSQGFSKVSYCKTSLKYTPLFCASLVSATSNSNSGEEEQSKKVQN